MVFVTIIVLSPGRLSSKPEFTKYKFRQVKYRPVLADLLKAMMRLDGAAVTSTVAAAHHGFQRNHNFFIRKIL